MGKGELKDVTKIIWAVAPDNYSGKAATAKYVSLKNYQWMTIIIQTGAWAAATAAVTLTQATAVAGTGAKALGFDFMWSDEVLSGTLARNTVTSNTFDLDTANKTYVIEVDPATVDGANGFDCVSVQVATPGVAADYYSAIYILSGPRYGGYNSPTAVLD